MDSTVSAFLWIAQVAFGVTHALMLVEIVHGRCLYHSVLFRALQCA